MLRSKLLSLGIVAGMAIGSAAQAAPVVVNFSGLGINGSNGNAAWSTLHSSKNQNDPSGYSIAKLDTFLPFGNPPLSYSITYESTTGALNNTGGLDGASLNIHQSDLLFDRNVANSNLTPYVDTSYILRLQSSTLTLEYFAEPNNFNNNIGTPAGNANPAYGLRGNLDFQILSGDGTQVLFDSVFILRNNDPDLVGGSNNPFNGLAVGSGGAGNLPVNDVVFFIWAGTADTTPQWWTSSNHDNVGLDLGAWGTPDVVPAPAGLLLLGFGMIGLAGMRRKTA